VGIGFQLLMLTIFPGIPVVGAFLVYLMVDRRAERFGYETAGAYLRAVPRSDAEKRDAADFALRGLVFCALGLMFAPLVLVGLVPLFYGGRKLVYASMGLGLVDDPDVPEA
jgi:hypothetical protein